MPGLPATLVKQQTILIFHETRINPPTTGYKNVTRNN